MQTAFRGFNAKQEAWQKRVIAKNKAGRLLAMPGTRQGYDGWYQGEGKVYHCTISEENEWQWSESMELREWRRKIGRGIEY